MRLATLADITSGVVSTDTIWDAKGDLALGTGSDTAQKLTAGTNGYTLVADSAQTTGAKWVSRLRTLTVVIDGGGSAITTGAKGVYLTVPWDCTLTGWRVLADQSGSITLDVWKDTYANFPPSVADTMISSGTKPVLSTAQKNEDLTIDWATTSLTSGDVLEVNVDSVATVTRVRLELFATEDA